MALIDRDIYLRNHVMSVLVCHTGKGLHYDSIGALADDITSAVIEGDSAWQEQKCCEQLREMSGEIDEDVPQ